MRKSSLIILGILFCAITHSQSLETNKWTYIEIDDSREMMHPPEGPDWLRSFGFDASDINGDGRLDVAEGYGTHESQIVDLDGDGDYDILSKPYNWKAPRLDIFLNTTEK